MNEDAKTSIWELLLAGAWCWEKGRGAEELAKSSLPRVVAELKTWYKRYRVKNPAAKITTIDDIHIGKLGTLADRTLKTKGLETKYLFLYLLDALVQHKRSIGEVLFGRLYYGSGIALRRYVDIIEYEAPVANSEPQRKELTSTK